MKKIRGLIYCLLLLQSGLKTGSLLVRLGRVLLHSALVLLLTFIINYLTKVPLLFSSDYDPLFPPCLVLNPPSLFPSFSC